MTETRQHPTCWLELRPGYMQHLSIPLQQHRSGLPVHTDLLCVLKRGNFSWQVGHCALCGRKQSVFCLG